MKRKLTIALIIVILLCCASSILISDKTKLKQLGYSESTIEKIKQLSSDNQQLFLKEYNLNLEALLLDSNYVSDNFNTYLTYDIPANNITYLVNNNLINDNNYTLLKDLTSDKFYLNSNTSLYLKYYSDFKEVRKTIEYVNCQAYKQGYVDYVDSDTSLGNLTIANKLYYLGNYEPDDLVGINTKYTYQDSWLTKEASEAYIKMADDARAKGEYFYISTAYRSYSFQNYLYETYLEEDSQSYVDTYSSRPGFSDHQTGLACDIRSETNTFESFTNTSQAKWLNDNSYKYGFILRYPEGKQDYTGYMYESWHFRYVGIEAATFIHENNITFEEYYAYQKELNNN